MWQVWVHGKVKSLFTDWFSNLIRRTAHIYWMHTALHVLPMVYLIMTIGLQWSPNPHVDTYNINWNHMHTHIPCGQITPASLLWLQSWISNPKIGLWGQLKRFVSFPLQATLARKIGPVPGPKMPLLFTLVSAIASGNCAKETHLQWSTPSPISHCKNGWECQMNKTNVCINSYEVVVKLSPL